MAVGNLINPLVFSCFTSRFALISQDPFRLAQRQQESGPDPERLNSQSLNSFLDCTLLSSRLPSDFRCCNISGHAGQIISKFALASR